MHRIPVRVRQERPTELGDTERRVLRSRDNDYDYQPGDPKREKHGRGLEYPIPDSRRYQSS